MEVGTMPYHWPVDTEFALWELDVLERDCPCCGRMMHVCDHRHRRIHTLEGPVHLVCKLNHCPDAHCPGHAKTKSPEVEATIAPPKWAIGWDVLCWIGHRRCARHWAIAQIGAELRDTYEIKLSEDSLTRYVQQYQNMLAARQQDPEVLRQQYATVEEIILCIDGLQPEKGHETLYVVRELTQKRVWFGEALISATAAEVRRLIAKAKQWAAMLGKRVVLWLSDKQDAFVTGIAAEFPGVPHRYCANHFLRDVAKPVLDADSHCKVQMRKKVRGLRKIEQAVLKHQAAAVSTDTTTDTTDTADTIDTTDTTDTADDTVATADTADETVATTVTAPADPQPGPPGPPAPADDSSAVVLDYCTAVRGILNDDQGGPLRPPGLRMADALAEVRASIQRNLDEKKGASRRSS
jgi:hypothetical protein